MKNTIKTIFALTIFTVFSASAQNGDVGIGTTSPHNSAALDVVSTTKGFLMPRMTTGQRTGITAPATGLQVYDTTTNTIWYFDGTVWVNNTASATTASNGLTATAGNITLGGTLSSVTTINQADNNLTFATGTARTIINGKFENNGAQYLKMTSVTSAAYTVADDDNFIIFTGSANSVFTLPTPATNIGRIIRIANPSSFQITFPGATIHPNMTITTTDGGFCNTYICDGSYWYPLAQ